MYFSTNTFYLPIENYWFQKVIFTFFSFSSASDCLIKDIQYEGQVYIQTEEAQPPSGTGTLQIYLDNEYLPVCYNGITHQIANSACRTLGYTNSLPANRVLE